jgi:hypothetical protein
MVETRDGTRIDAILTDTACTFADFYWIAKLREEQREAMRKSKPPEVKP